MKNTNTEAEHKSLEQLYLKQDFDGAQKYILENKSQMDRGVFHYNLGTIHLKKEEYAIGRYHFEKAIKKGFYSPQLHNNLEYSLENLEVAQFEKPEHIGQEIYLGALGLPPAAYITASIFFLVLFLLLRLFFKKLSWGIVVLGTILVLLPIGLRHGVWRDHRFAVCFKQGDVREGPSEVFKSTYKVPKGVKLVVEKPRDGWYLIRYPKQYIGWIKARDLGLL